MLCCAVLCCGAAALCLYSRPATTEQVGGGNVVGRTESLLLVVRAPSR